MVKKLILIFGLLIGISSHVVANEKDIVTNSELAIAAFSCYAYNSFLKRDGEAERLFKLGYDASISFYQQAGKTEISTKAKNENIPFIYLTTSGPNGEFNTGQIFSSVVGDAFKKIYQDSKLDFVYDEKLRVMNAESLVRKSNCGLLK